MNNANHLPGEHRHDSAARSQGARFIIGETMVQSQVRLVMLITATIFICELFVMFILHLVGPLPAGLNAAIDALLLVVLMSPILYFGLFRALIRHIVDCRRIEEELKRELALNAALSNELEQRVAERTQKLLQSNEILKMEVRERRLAEQKLQQIKSNLQAVFDSIEDPLVLLERDMTVKMYNKSAARYYGLSGHPEALDVRCHQLLMNSARPCEGCMVSSGIANGKGVMFERPGFMQRDRLEKVFLYPVSREGSEDGETLMRISDITEERMLERQLIHSEKMAALGVLVSSIAHEINNPNSFISFNIPILRDYLDEMMPILDIHAESHPDFEIGNMPYGHFRRDISTLLDNVEHGSRRISSFVSNLKDFSRFREDVKEEWVHLGQVIEKVTAICSARLKSDVESFMIDLPEDLPMVWSDPDALEQILINLLINAAQAVEKKGSWVRLAVRVRDSWVDHAVLEVADNGSGMDEETLKKALDPFFTTKSREGGVGLGLYVCQNLVERLRGRIDIESRPGSGSRFQVILPDKERRSQQRL